MEAIPLCPIGNIIALSDFVSGYGAQKLLRAGGVTSFVKRYDAREFRNEILVAFQLRWATTLRQLFDWYYGQMRNATALSGCSRDQLTGPSLAFVR